MAGWRGHLRVVDKLSPAFQPGRADVRTTLVLAAPGLDEAAAGRPAAGRTGTVLDLLLGRLHAVDALSFPSGSRLDYRIVNAVDLVLAGARSLPTKRQIRDPANLARLGRQLAGSDVVVAFGPHAVTAVRAVGLEPTLCSGHPGMQGVNQLPVEEPGTGPANTRARLDLFASLLLASRGRCSEAMLGWRDIRRESRMRRADPGRGARPGPEGLSPGRLTRVGT